MSWRFRKVLKLAPGVKLNMTQRGPSITVGAPPLSFNIGPKGVYRNMSIPGTGMWDRQQIYKSPSAVPAPLVGPPARAVRRKMVDEGGRRLLVNYVAAHKNFITAFGESIRHLAACQRGDEQYSTETMRAGGHFMQIFFDAAGALERDRGDYVSSRLRQEFAAWINALDATSIKWGFCRNEAEMQAAWQAFLTEMNRGEKISEEFVEAINRRLENSMQSNVTQTNLNFTAEHEPKGRASAVVVFLYFAAAATALYLWAKYLAH